MGYKNIDWFKKLQLLKKALEKNGVKAGLWVEIETKISGYELDFSEHDKVFEDKIARLEENVGYYKDSLSRVEKNCDKLYHENKELKQRIAEFESKETVDLPFDALETANYLINATWERETSSLERGILKCPKYVSNNKYGIDELEQIAEHLLIYCKHNKDFENDGK